MKKHLMFGCMVLGLAFQAENVLGSAFKVTPVRIAFSGPSSTLLTLKNESDQPLRFQITAFAWAQDEKGEMQLTATDDVIFFPALLSLKAGEERKVRVASRVAAGEVERTYRIFFEELPPLETPSTETSAAQIRILTKMGIPIFVAPQKGAAHAQIGDTGVAQGKLRFKVENSGNVHFALQGVTVKGVGAEGQTLFERQLDGWYVLARSPRLYEIEIPRDSCAKLREVTIEAQTGLAGSDGAVTKKLDLAPAACD